jgi:hypothetical protein
VLDCRKMEMTHPAGVKAPRQSANAVPVTKSVLRMEGKPRVIDGIARRS